MGKDELKFTKAEEAEFEQMVKIQPKGFAQHAAVAFDKVANSIWTFFVLLAFSAVGFFMAPDIMNKMLYYSNTYQLIALPLLGVATSLSTAIILRFLFRIFKKIMSEFAELKAMHKQIKEIHAWLKELHAWMKEVREWIQKQEGGDTHDRKSI